MIKVNVEVKDIEQTKLTLTKDHGVIIDIKNIYMFENPLNNFDDNDQDDHDASMPFFEMEIAHKLHATMSQYSSEVIDFDISSIKSEIIRYGVYYQSEAQLTEDEEALNFLSNMLEKTYIEDVNKMPTQVTMDEENDVGNRARVDIPIHQMLLKSIDNLDIHVYDGFLLIEADPRKFES